MTPENFVYWLQGFAEMNGDTPPNDTQWKSIKDHIALVMKKEAPVRISPNLFQDTTPYPLNPNPYIGPTC